MHRIFPGWPLVGAIMIALALCGTTVIVSTFGLLTAQWARSFGWSQGAMATGLSLFLLSTVLAVPLVGEIVDRCGSRRTAIGGIVTFAVILVAAGLSIGSLPLLFLFYILFGFAGAFTNPIVYIKALSKWFDRKRGLALGLAVAGQGVGAALLPPLIQTAIETFGWRSAFHVTAAGLLLFALPAILLFVRDDPAEAGAYPDGAVGADGPRSAGPAIDLMPTEAVRTSAFWIIVIVFALFGAVGYALTSQFVYLMLHRGVGTLQQIAMLLSVAGAAMILGRLFFGWLFDRYSIPLVGAAGASCGSIALLLLLGVDSVGPAAVAMSVLMGVAMGAETDLLSLLVSRYFGQAAISRIYSWHNVSFLAGAALGPPMFAALLGQFPAPTVPVAVLVAMNLLATALLLLLRRPFTNQE